MTSLAIFSLTYAAVNEIGSNTLINNYNLQDSLLKILSAGSIAMASELASYLEIVSPALSPIKYYLWIAYLPLILTIIGMMAVYITAYYSDYEMKPKRMESQKNYAKNRQLYISPEISEKINSFILA